MVSTTLGDVVVVPLVKYVSSEIGSLEGSTDGDEDGKFTFFWINGWA